jgi:sulfide:quinone oxidoreductase
MDAPRQVLVAGGGPAAIEASLALQRLAEERVRITLVSDTESFTYRPSATVQPFGFPPPQRFSLPGLAADRGFGFIGAPVRSVDGAAHRIDAGGEPLAYDALVLALGAAYEAAVPGALTFGGRRDVACVHDALRLAAAGPPARVAFVAPPGVGWTLPMYELALLAARWARERGLAIEPWIVTHEDRALGVFGGEASRSVVALLEEAGVRLWTGAVAELVEDGRLWMSMEGGLPVALAVALPRPVGRALPGVACDERGFVPVDGLGRVAGLPDVYAVGDMTTRPLKQGGLAAQQADAAASAIAAWSGAPVTPTPYHPVLRAVLLTGDAPRFLRRGAPEPGVPASLAAGEAAWWPPHKIAARELSPYLEAHPELLLA